MEVSHLHTDSLLVIVSPFTHFTPQAKQTPLPHGSSNVRRRFCIRKIRRENITAKRENDFSTSLGDESRQSKNYDSEWTTMLLQLESLATWVDYDRFKYAHCNALLTLVRLIIAANPSLVDIHYIYCLLIHKKFKTGFCPRNISRRN